MARNTLWSLFGYTAPLAVALIAVPILTSELGPNRFGVLSLAWAVIGYSSIFDLGLGRALTKVVAERLSAEAHEVPALFWSTWSILAIIGFFSTSVLFVAAPVLVDNVIKVPSDLHDESLWAFRIMALSIPFITTSAGMRGLVEAQQGFRVVGIMNSITWSMTLIAPLIVLPVSRSLVATMAALFFGRILTWAAYVVLCVRRTPQLLPVLRPTVRHSVPTLRFGAWLTVSNVVGPFLTYFDRFVISFVVSVAAVTYYSVSYDMVLRVAVFASAVTSVLFPTFASSFANHRLETIESYRWGIRTTLVLVTPVALSVLLVGPEVLILWLGRDIGVHGAGPLQWLTLGVFINCLAQVPYSLIQASGRPDLTAKLHMTELVPYLITLWVLVNHWGINGAAVAWNLRVTADALLIFFLIHVVFPEGRGVTWRLAFLVLVAWMLGGAIQFPIPFNVRAGLLGILLALLVPITWRWGLDPGEKVQVRQAMCRLIPRSWLPSPRGTDNEL